MAEKDTDTPEEEDDSLSETEQTFSFDMGG